MRKGMFVSLLLLVSFFFSALVHAQEKERSVEVRKTFDKTPFRYHEKKLEQRPGYTIFHLKYPSPTTTPVVQNNTIPAEYYLPDGIRPGDPRRPAVICLHILNGNDALTDLLCSTLASHGVPAMMFRLPYYGERGLPEGPIALATDPRRFSTAIQQAFGDIQRTIDLLASRPEIDPEKIGISGISLGGIVAASAAGHEPRIHRAALLLAGGDLLSIIHHARETAPLSNMLKAQPDDTRVSLEGDITAVDPLTFAPSLQQRALQGQVLMINASEDEVIPKKSTEKLADALAISDKIVWLDGLGHYTALAELPRAMDLIAQFFAHDLPPRVSLPKTDRRKPEMRRLAQLLHQSARLLTEKPEAGKCHIFSAEFTANSSSTNPIQGRLRVIRDAEQRFAISGKFPIIGDVALGQGEYPWFVSNGTALVGTEKPLPALKTPEAIFGKSTFVTFRSAAGLFESLSQTPEVLSRYFDVGLDAASAKRLLHLKGKLEFLGDLHLQFEDRKEIPSKLTYQNHDQSGEARILEWTVDAEARPELFNPPENLPVKKSNQAEIYQMFEILRVMLLRSV